MIQGNGNNMKIISDISIKNKVALLRLNLNVPIDNGIIKDDFRMKAVMPTIEYCKKHAKKTVILAHLGRPEGADQSLSLKQLVPHLSELLGSEVSFINDCVGNDVRTQIDEAPDGSVILLENVRFHEEEIKNDQEFGAELAKNGDVFINDAFGDSAKAHASVYWPAKILPAVAGLRLQEEVEQFDKVRTNPESPFVVIIGGAKIKEKMGVIRSLGKQADHILIGGAIANTMFKAQGMDVKESLIQEDELGVAKELLNIFADKLVLPIDVGVATKVNSKFEPSSYRYCPPDRLREGEAILDIGVQAMEHFEDVLSRAQTIFWAGPLGYIEWEPSSKHSVEIAHLLAGFLNTTLAGGGETATVLKMADVEDQIDFVSTGGSAALKYLAGEELPGISLLNV